MEDLTRRSFAGLSFGSVASVLSTSPPAFAAIQCVAPPRQPYLPNLLLIPCASRQNFQIFRRYSRSLGLAGVVAMSNAQGAHGVTRAGTLIVFPWVRMEGPKARRTSLMAALPTSLSASSPTSVIPDSTLPQDEYVCRYLLQAPWQDFIGFTVEDPFGADQAGLNSCSNIPRLADGKGIGIDWTSSNLNQAWFGGSRFIPDDAACGGTAWRTLIANALNSISTGAC